MNAIITILIILILFVATSLVCVTAASLMSSRLSARERARGECED
jgi:hypothetical protein